MKKSADALKVTKTKTVSETAVPKRTRAPRKKTATPDVAADVVVEQEVMAWTSPSDDDVARRAYEIFEARADQEGDALSDWLQAEQELKLQR